MENGEKQVENDGEHNLDSKHMDTLSNDVVNNCIKGLHDCTNHTMASTVYLHKKGAGLTSSCSSFWDEDDSQNVGW